MKKTQVANPLESHFPPIPIYFTMSCLHIVDNMHMVNSYTAIAD